MDQISDDYTPTTWAVKTKYVLARMMDADRDGGSVLPTVRFHEEFDRWLAAHDAEVRADGVELEYGVENNITEAGIDEGYSSEERALSVAAMRTSQYITPGARAWAVKRVKAGPWIPVEKGVSDD